MAVDKLVDSTQLDSDLTSVANAIRTAGGTSASLSFPSGFVTAIGNISGGGGGSIPAGYVVRTINVTTAITNALQLWNLFASELSDIIFAFVYFDRDWTTSPETNNQFVDALYTGTQSTSVWMRYRNNAYASNTNWTSSYDIAVAAGSTIIAIAKIST